MHHFHIIYSKKRLRYFCSSLHGYGGNPKEPIVIKIKRKYISKTSVNLKRKFVAIALLLSSVLRILIKFIKKSKDEHLRNLGESFYTPT